MPRKTKHPGLRTHVRKGRDGQVWVYYYLDRRKEQLPDLPLGKDRDEALKLWDEARAKAATKSRESGDDDLAHEIEAMWLRDMRKYASDKAAVWTLRRTCCSTLTRRSRASTTSQQELGLRLCVESFHNKIFD